MRGTRKRNGARPALRGLAAALVLTAGAAIAGGAAEPAAVTPAEPPAQTVVPGADARQSPGSGRWSYLRPRLTASELKVHIDPQTGTPVTPPDKARQSTALPAAFSRSHEGLEAVTLANGYRYVDSRGRLMSALVATVGEDGEIEVGHAPPAPEASASGAAGTAGTAETGEDGR